MHWDAKTQYDLTIDEPKILLNYYIQRRLSGRIFQNNKTTKNTYGFLGMDFPFAYFCSCKLLGLCLLNDSDKVIGNTDSVNRKMTERSEKFISVKGNIYFRFASHFHLFFHIGHLLDWPLVVKPWFWVSPLLFRVGLLCILSCIMAMKMLLLFSRNISS